MAGLCRALGWPMWCVLGWLWLDPGLALGVGTGPGLAEAVGVPRQSLKGSHFKLNKKNRIEYKL